jgi:hypothetical protein
MNNNEIFIDIVDDDNLKKKIKNIIGIIILRD